MPFGQMWHTAVWLGHPMRLEVTREGYTCVCVCVCMYVCMYIFQDKHIYTRIIK